MRDEVAKTIQLEFAATVAGQLAECVVMATGNLQNAKIICLSMINMSLAVNFLNFSYCLYEQDKFFLHFS